jgi:hypothetical protein
MTTPAAVAAQPNVPSKAGIGAVRDTGGKNDDARTAEGEEQGFGDVLSELQQSGSDELAPAKGSRTKGEWVNTRLADTEAQLSPQDGASDPKAGSEAAAADSDLQLPGDLQPVGADTVQTDLLGLDATATNGMGGVAAANLVLASAKPEPKGSTGVPAHQTDETTGTAGDSPSAKVGQADARIQLSEAAAKHELDPANSGDVASDPMLGRLGPSATPVDKDKSERVNKGRTQADVSMPQAVNGAGALVQPHDISAAAQRPKANVLRQETHFAPVSSPAASAGESGKSDAGSEALGSESSGTTSTVAALPSFEDASSLAASPGQQIADRIAAEVNSAPEFAERVGVPPPLQQGMKAALKVLQIQLQPVDLGIVTVRMELKNSELTLHVEADRKETADLIRNDQDSLAGLLRSAGYNVDTASVRIVEGDKTLASQQSGQQGAQANLQSSANSQSGASDRQGHAQRGGSNANGGDTPQTGRNDTHETANHRAGRGVYV